MRINHRCGSAGRIIQCTSGWQDCAFHLHQNCKTQCDVQKVWAPFHCRGKVGLTITRRILEQQPGLQLFSLRADAARRRLIVALDKVCS